ERRLARAVGPDQADDASGLDRHRHVVEGTQRAERHRDPVGSEEAHPAAPSASTGRTARRGTSAASRRPANPRPPAMPSGLMMAVAMRPTPPMRLVSPASTANHSCNAVNAMPLATNMPPTTAPDTVVIPPW